MWTNHEDLVVGEFGSGTLSVTDGAVVNVGGNTHVARNPGSSGSIHLDGGTLNTSGLVAGMTQLVGSGTINTHGLVYDTNMTFDSMDDLVHAIMVDNQPVSQQGITLNVDIDGQGILGAGQTGNGSLSIQSGVTISSTYGYLGYHPGSTGYATIEGAGSTWTNSSHLYVGHFGSGTLTIANGAVVSNDHAYIGNKPGATGFVSVEGEGSTWIANGSISVDFGELNIESSGVVTSESGWIGNGSDANGRVTVSGVGSSWINEGDLYVNSGELIITNGGSVSNDDTTVAYKAEANSQITIDGAESSWECSSYFTLGYHGDATLNISNGGTFYCGGPYNYIARESTSTSIATVKGTGSMLTTNSDFIVAENGNGTLNISDGGTVHTGRCIIAGFDNGIGNITVDGTNSTLVNNGSLYVGEVGEGTLNIINGGQVHTDHWSYIGYGYKDGLVHVEGNGSTWTIGHDLRLYRSSVLSISLAGLVSVEGTLAAIGQNTFVDMSNGGMLALAGNADDSLNDFLALIGRTDVIRWWNGSLGDWDLLTSATMGTDYTLEYLTEGDLAGYTMLTVGTAPVPGDANGDGVVDGSDVTILAGNWQVGVDDGQTATRAMGDFNGDGQVDGSDVTILAGNWQYGVGAAANAVPEPSCIGLLLTLLAVGLARAGGLALSRKECDNR